ncbi:MAG: competence protein ComE [Leptotrichiaceae bacterium]|nr:competence protein ComE [Leptotrichiaceae bacterium]
MAANGYHMEINRKTVKRVIGKTIVLIIVLVTAFFLTVYLFSRKMEKIIKADIQIETQRFENAVKGFKEKTGVYPGIAGKENNLKEIKSPDGKYTFDLFYGTEKLYEIPGNLKKGIEKSNNTVFSKNNKGGWVYNGITGEVKPNIE